MSFSGLIVVQVFNNNYKDGSELKSTGKPIRVLKASGKSKPIVVKVISTEVKSMTRGAM